MRFSASQLKTWSNCALKAKYHYIDGMQRRSTGTAAHMGSAVHVGLEKHYKDGGGLDVALSEFDSYYMNPDNYPDKVNRGTTFNGGYEKGVKMLTAYFEDVAFDQYDRIILGAEVPFKVDFAGHDLTGFIDLLYTNTGYLTLAIQDWKTGRRPNTDSLYLDVQGTCYAWAVSCKEFWVGHDGDDKYPGIENGEELYERFKNVQPDVIWYDLKNNKPYSFGRRTTQDFARLYRLMQMIERAVETDTYIPTISGDSCGFCEYQDICPVYFDDLNRFDESPVSVIL